MPINPASTEGALKRSSDEILALRECVAELGTERDRYRRALDFMMRCDNLDRIKGYVAETLNPTPIPE